MVDMEWWPVPYLVGAPVSMVLHPLPDVQDDRMSSAEIASVHTVSSLLVNAWHAWNTDYEPYYRPPSAVSWALLATVQLYLRRRHDALAISSEIWWTGLRFPRPTTATEAYQISIRSSVWEAGEDGYIRHLATFLRMPYLLIDGLDMRLIFGTRHSAEFLEAYQRIAAQVADQLERSYASYKAGPEPCPRPDRSVPEGCVLPPELVDRILAFRAVSMVTDLLNGIWPQLERCLNKYHGPMSNEMLFPLVRACAAVNLCWRMAVSGYWYLWTEADRIVAHRWIPSGIVIRPCAYNWDIGDAFARIFCRWHRLVGMRPKAERGAHWFKQTYFADPETEKRLPYYNMRIDKASYVLEL